MKIVSRANPHKNPNLPENFRIPKDFYEVRPGNSGEESMNGNKRMKTRVKIIYPAFALVVFACFTFLRGAQGQLSPPPDGCYPNFTTAEGCNALQSLTPGVGTGLGNTAFGWSSLSANTEGSYNTAVGAGALNGNIGSSNNTAIGAAALLLNRGTGNTATGTDALAYNFSGSNNTADGAFALFFSNGGYNTAVGYFALENTNSRGNTAVGVSALISDVDGEQNTAIGDSALYSNTGDFNIGVGTGAGQNLTTGNHNIDIDNAGVAGESGTIRIGDPGFARACFIAGINSATASGGTAVFIDSNGQLGTLTSSARFKDDIKPMEKASEAILSLRPVTFRYKHELDLHGIPQFGLVAEDVEKVNPDLVARDADGKPYTVRYEAVNAMLLNEFLKAHRRIQQLEANNAQQQRNFIEQQKQIDALTASVQKVSAQLEMTKRGPQTVLNNP